MKKRKTTAKDFADAESPLKRHLVVEYGKDLISEIETVERWSILYKCGMESGAADVQPDDYMPILQQLGGAIFELDAVVFSRFASAIRKVAKHRGEQAADMQRKKIHDCTPTCSFEGEPFLTFNELKRKIRYTGVDAVLRRTIKGMGITLKKDRIGRPNKTGK